MMQQTRFRRSAAMYLSASDGQTFLKTVPGVKRDKHVFKSTKII